MPDEMATVFWGLVVLGWLVYLVVEVVPYVWRHL